MSCRNRECGKRVGMEAWLLLIVSGLFGCGLDASPENTETAKTSEHPEKVPANQNFYIRLPGVRKPDVQSANAANVDENSRVIGVTVGGRPRAYVMKAMTMLGTHIVNDLVEDVPVTVTYCDRTGCVRVLTQADESEALPVNLGGWVDGKMNLLWEGKLYAQNDDKIPMEEMSFMVTTWKEWKSLYPETDVYTGAASSTKGG